MALPISTKENITTFKISFYRGNSCLSDIAWKTKAAVDLHTKGSMLLQRNKTFALISN